MKEAAGEANLTVIAIILIAIIVAVATPLISSLMKTSAKRSCCTDVGGVWEGSKCKAPAGTSDLVVGEMEEEYINCQTNAGVSSIDGF